MTVETAQTICLLLILAVLILQRRQLELYRRRLLAAELQLLTLRSPTTPFTPPKEVLRKKRGLDNETVDHYD